VPGNCRHIFEANRFITLLMKMSPRFIVLVLLAAAVMVPLAPLPARAENDDIRLLRTYPKLSAEETRQLLFKGGIQDNPLLWFELHNPFRDREIAALVIGVSFKRPGEEKPTEYEVLVHAPCGPLQSVHSSTQNIFDGYGAAKLNPTITLKEVYLVLEPKAEEK